jgi:hypothetical protein
MQKSKNIFGSTGIAKILAAKNIGTKLIYQNFFVYCEINRNDYKRSSGTTLKKNT